MLAAAFGVLWLGKREAPAATASAIEINPPEGGHFTPMVNVGGSAVSMDGRTLAFVATTSTGQNLLHLRRLGSLDARAIPGTEEAGRPFWSLDGKSIAFVARGAKRISMSVQFFNAAGDAMFKIFVGRDEKRELKPEQVQKFEALRARYA